MISAVACFHWFICGTVSFSVSAKQLQYVYKNSKIQYVYSMSKIHAVILCILCIGSYRNATVNGRHKPTCFPWVNVKIDDTALLPWPGVTHSSFSTHGYMISSTALIELSARCTSWALPERGNVTVGGTAGISPFSTTAAVAASATLLSGGRVPHMINLKCWRNYAVQQAFTP